MRKITLYGLLLVSFGCRQPVEAPDELDQLMGWLFEQVESDDDEGLYAGAGSLLAWMDAHPEETFDNGYAVDGLTSSTVDGLEGEQRDLSNLVGVAVGYPQENTMENLVEKLVWIPDDPESQGYLSYEHDELRGSAECLNAMTCQTATREVWMSQSYPLGLEVSSHLTNEYRWFETDFGEAFVYRNWTIEPPTSNKQNLLDIQQTYFMWMLVPSAEGVKSMQASWVVVDVLNGTVESEALLSIWVNSMKSSAESLDDNWFE